MFKARRAAAVVGVAGAIAAALLAGCGSNSDSSSGSGTTTASAGKLDSLLFVNPLPNNPQWRLIGDCVKRAAAAHGVDSSEAGSTGELDATQLLQQVQQGIASRKGAIITYPASPAFGPVLEQAERVGIVVGTMYGGTGTALGQFNTGPDFAALGRLFVDSIADRPGPQRLGLLAVSPTGQGKAWVDGVKAAAAQTDNVTVEGVVYTDDDPAKALTQANALLAAHPDINVLASHMGTATTPSVSAIKSKGLKGRVIMLANGGVNGGVEGAREGVVYRFMLQNLCREGEDAVNAAVALAEGRSAPRQIQVQVSMVGLDDYATYQKRGWM
jgi:ABC-type sugar transport system substrate-binding protein